MKDSLRTSTLVCLVCGTVIFGISEITLGGRVFQLLLESMPRLRPLLELPALHALLPFSPVMAWFPCSLFLGLFFGVGAKYFYLLFLVPPNPQNLAQAQGGRGNLVATWDHLRHTVRVCPGFQPELIQKDLLIWGLEKPKNSP